MNSPTGFSGTIHPHAHLCKQKLNNWALSDLFKTTEGIHIRAKIRAKEFLIPSAMLKSLKDYLSPVCPDFEPRSASKIIRAVLSSNGSERLLEF